jgi:hypothetical protein
MADNQEVNIVSTTQPILFHLVLLQEDKHFWASKYLLIINEITITLWMQKVSNV